VVYSTLKKLAMSTIPINSFNHRYFTFLTACHNPKACTILLRGPSKDIINEIERNLQDAMFVTRNIYFHPRLCPGGGATEMAIAVRLAEKAKTIPGVMAWPYKSVADAMEVIPRTLVQNCGGNAVKVLTDLRVSPTTSRLKLGKTCCEGTFMGHRWRFRKDCGYA
jgi:T-complex protein 1 subunit gamma